MRTHVVVATDVPTRSERGEQLVQLVRWLKRRGLNVEILALGEGTIEALEFYRSVARTTIVDRFRRRGIASLPRTLGQDRLSSAVKGRRLRRWMSKRESALFLIHHPLAASVVRYAPGHPGRVVGMLSDSSWKLDDLRTDDMETLKRADAWITTTSAQSEAVSGFTDAPVLELPSAGAMVDPAELPVATLATADAPTVVLLPSPDVWNSVDHSVEIAWQIMSKFPEATIRWVVDDAEDRWLTNHDINHAMLGADVLLVRSTDSDVLCGATVVARSGYHRVHSELVLAAALAGIPVRGMNTQDLPEAAIETEPFAVETLVDDLVRLLSDHDYATESGRALGAQVAHLNLEHQISQLIELISARSGTE